MGQAEDCLEDGRLAGRSSDGCYASLERSYSLLQNLDSRLQINMN